VDAWIDSAIGPHDVVAVRVGAPVEALVAAVAPVFGAIEPRAQPERLAPEFADEALRQVLLRLVVGIGGNLEAQTHGLASGGGERRAPLARADAGENR